MPIKAHLALLAPLVVSPAFADVKESVDWIAPRMAKHCGVWGCTMSRRITPRLPRCFDYASAVG